MAAYTAEPNAAFVASTNAPGRSGLVGTIGVRIVDGAGNTTVVARATAGIVEIPAGSGIYVKTLSAPGAVGTYQVVWDTGGGTPAYAEDDLAVAVSAVTPTSVGVTLVSPVDLAADVTIVQGDDYNSADGRQLDWTDTGSTWPDLTSAAVTMTLTHRETRATVTYTASIIVASGAGKKVRAQPTAVQTLSLPAGGHSYDVKAVLSNTHTVTLIRGTATVVTNP